MARYEYYSYAQVRQRDPLSGELETECVGYDGPDPLHVAQARAERIAEENRRDPNIHAARPVVVRIDTESGEESIVESR